MTRIGCALLALSTFLTTACGDITGATGAKGRVNYSLYTHYEVDDWNLGEVSLVTGHPQLIQTEITDKGLDQLDGEASEIIHLVEPAEGVQVTNKEDEDIADLLVTVSDPGEYTIQSQLDGEIFDYLELSFGTPDELELITWMRNPSADDFELAESTTIAIDEGGQVTFLPVPRSGGVRLAGDITVDALFNSMPFDNTITTMFLSGREVQELLDYVSDRSTDRGCNSQAQVAGIQFDMMCDPDDPRAENILINGAALDLDGTYELATNNYIAHGGSGFEVLERNTTQVDTGISIRDVVQTAIIQHHTLPQADDSICVEDGRINPVF